MRHLLTFICFLLLGCGGGSGSAPDAPICVIPREIVFQNDGNELTQTQHFSSSGSRTLYGDAATRAIFDCGAPGVQKLSFELYSDSFFSTVGDHVAVLTKSKFIEGTPYYLARGVIVHRDWGLLGERFYKDGNTTNMVLQCTGGSCAVNALPDAPYPHPVPTVGWDGTIYRLSLHSDHASVTYNLSNNLGGSITDTWSEANNYIDLHGTGFAFAILCMYNSCNAQQARFTIRLSNIRFSSG